ncbi:MAG: hypothetical protein KC619_15645 [Myxococcales bacterium]|nr:hypothetical protein [Myxococcales bacterium]
MTRRAPIGLFALALLAACGEKAPRTQVMLVIDAEPAIRAEARSLHLEVFGGEDGMPASTYARRYVRDFEDPTFPWSLALVPFEPDPPRAWRALVETRRADGTPLTRSTLRGGYAAEHTVRLDFLVEDDCAGVLCADLRCEAGACVDPLVDVGTLPELVVDGGT